MYKGIARLYLTKAKKNCKQTKTRLHGGPSGLILEVSSGRLVLAPAVVAAKIALRSRTRTKRELGDCC